MTIIEMNQDCFEYLELLADYFSVDTVLLRSYYDEFPKVERWGGGTVEPAVGQMLYIITRLLGPITSLELGTNVGYSTFCIAAALKHNGEGLLYTFDIDREMIHEAIRRVALQGCESQVIYRRGDSTKDLDPFLTSYELKPDLIFIDSSHEYESTKVELEIIQRHMEQWACILFHDALAPESGVTRALNELESNQKYNMLRIPTQPNTGFGILQILK